MKILGDKVFFFPTRDCNLRCQHCFIVASEKIPRKVLQVGTKIIDGLTKYHGKELRLAGGEPTIVPGLPTLVSSANQRGINVSVITNGSRFNGCWIRTLGNNMKNRVWFSIYGTNPKTHDYVTGVHGSFQSISKAISRTLTAGITVGYNVPITKPIINQAECLLKQAMTLKISTIKFLWITPPYYCSEKTNSILPTKKEIEKFLYMKPYFLEIAHRISLRFPITSEEVSSNSNSYGKCFIQHGKPLFTVIGSGEVFPCCLYAYKQHAILGNILNNSWERIHESFQHFLHYLAKKPDLCCPALTITDGNKFCPIAFTKSNERETRHV